MDTSHVGAAAEVLAAGYLRRLGLRVLEHNFRMFRNEIDLICLDQRADTTSRGVIVFVEVKYRKARTYGGAEAAVAAAKQHALIRAARGYLASRNLQESQCRFDVIALTGSISTPEIEHFEDAFHIPR